MKIKSLYFKDKSSNLELEKIEFDNLNLLVGVSGAGKTTILKIIDYIKSIVIDSVFLKVNGYYIKISAVEFDILFLTNQNIECRWVFESEENSEKKIKITKEDIYYNNKLRLSKNKNELKINDIIYPKLTHNESIIKLLDADFINDIIDSLADINIFNEYVELSLSSYKIDKFKIIDNLKKSNLNTLEKLLIAQENFKEEFECIKTDFISIFPNIQDIYFSKIDTHSSKVKYVLQFRENNDWISIDNISSGMLKTLNFLAQVKLSSTESVLLIDEFENSLGVNCIDIVSDSLLNSTGNMQYIITSHHPYIINKIDMKYWKIVTRKGNVIQVKNISELNLPKSKHESFKQLLNLKEFKDGILI